ncbi:hypothetical protein HK100_003713 [Physocladia obscura]|uniref:Centrosomin N-terminal motif 1 domain-containing protein n=1 Tax=Physocladia obscura TaxID=109957 RepID=A0AAD5X978_9FUNG|nr:hypothetical protein HK100_003713 [Physocladia obscura]
MFNNDAAFSSPLREHFEDEASFVEQSSFASNSNDNNNNDDDARDFVDARERNTGNNGSTESLNAGFSSTLGIKERDKILDDLKKENFNLKLRIFFLEERLERLCGDGDKKPSKENIVLKLQAEIEDLEMDLIDERGNLHRVSNELENSNFLNEQLSDEVEQLRKARQDVLEARALAENKCDAIENELDRIVSIETSTVIKAPNNVLKNQKLKGVPAVKARIEELTLKSQSLESQVSSLSITVSDLQIQLAESEESNEKITGELKTAKKECLLARAKLSSASEELNDWTQSKTELENALTESIASHDRVLAKLSIANGELNELKKLKAKLEESLQENEAACSSAEERFQTYDDEIEELKMKIKLDEQILGDLNSETNVLKKALEEKTANEQVLQNTIHNMKLQQQDLKSRREKDQLAINEACREVQNLQQELQNALSRLEQVESGHFQKANELENEIRDLHVQLSRQAQERATELEQCVTRYKARSPEMDVSKLRNDHEAEVSLLRAQISDFDRLSQIAASEMNTLRHELEAQTRKLHEIEDRWRAEKASREAAVVVDVEQRDMQLREVEERWRGVLDEERAFLREEVGVRDARVSEMQAEVSRLCGELGSVKGELDARVSMHEEAQRRFREVNSKIQLELDSVLEERDELMRILESIQREGNMRTQQVDAFVEAFKDILNWINTILGVSEVDLSQINDAFTLKQHIRAGLEDLQQIREYFSESLRETKQLFDSETHFSIILSRLAKFEEIVKKATVLQRKLKFQLEQAKKDLIAAQTSQTTQSTETSLLQSQLFTLRNDLVVAQTESQDIRGELERSELALQVAQERENAYKKELYTVRSELTAVKTNCEREREYSEKVVKQFKSLEAVESEGAIALARVRRELREAIEREKFLETENAKKVEEVEGVYEERMRILEKEIGDVQKVRYNEKKAMDTQIHAMDEELLTAKRRVEISEQHLQNMKQSKAVSPQKTNFDDPGGLASANDRLRTDYMHMRRLVEEKEAALQDMRNQKVSENDNAGGGSFGKI